MRILFYLCRFPGWGGIETVTERVGLALLGMGHEIHVLSHFSQDRPSALREQASFYAMPDGKPYVTRRNREFARRLVVEKGIDIVVYQDCYEPTERIAFAMQAAGARLLVFEHNTPLYVQKTLASFPKGSLVKQAYRFFSHPAAIRKSAARHLRLLKEADAYIVLADGFVKELRELCGWRATEAYAHKIHVVNNPVCAPEPVPESVEKENKILFVGQVNDQKRVGLMLDAWKVLQPRHAGWTFQIVGDGPLRETLAARIREEGIVGVEMCGYQQPAPYYGAAKLFWMTSLFEGWPMTLLEAMQAGCVPIVMDTFAPVHDVIETGREGFIVPEGDLEGFLQASERLMDGDGLWTELSVAAQEKTTLFSMDRILSQWGRLIG